MVHFFLAAICLIFGCAENPKRPAPVESGWAFSLVHGLQPTSVTVPDNNRPDGKLPTDTISIPGPFKLLSSNSSVDVYQAPLPFRPRALFFFNPLQGMNVFGPDGALTFRRGSGAKANTWNFDALHLTVTLPAGHQKPIPGSFGVSYPLAEGRENRLNYGFSGIDLPADFIEASIFAAGETRSGLLIPAPGSASWEFEVPPSAELHISPGLVPPETLDAPPSDGAFFIAEVTSEGETKEVWSLQILSGGFKPIAIGLSAYAGKIVQLTLRTEPGPNARFDYAFFGDPTVSSRLKNPKRVVFIFVDTVRPDHLSTFGYERNTSPNLTKFSKTAAVFTNARSIAPWTLPSTRTVVTGRYPDEYQAAKTLQSTLRKRGYATAFFNGNVYLSSNFEMDRDWARHRSEIKVGAKAQTERAIKWLEQNSGRDSLLMLHFMDAHLDYQEPVSHRFTFAGPSKGGLGERFNRNDVIRKYQKKSEVRDYLIDRYDNNIRYIDDSLAPLFDQLTENDIVVYFSDHGEEFWEHGGYEHGHSLYDELLRVPLILSGPGVEAGRFDEPVSLLDVTPTVLELLDEQGQGLDGRSLVPLTSGDKQIKDEFLKRELGFGWPLYGDDRWGSLQWPNKWTTHRNRGELFKLDSDPLEENNLLKIPDDDLDEIGQAHLTTATNRSGTRLIRLINRSGKQAQTEDLIVQMNISGGISSAWVGGDPTETSSAEVEIDEDVVTVRWHKGYRGTREVYVKPTGDLVSAINTLSATLLYDGEATEIALTAPRIPLSRRQNLGRGRLKNHTVTIGLGVSLMPAADTSSLDGYDEEVEGMLQALGYIEE